MTNEEALEICNKALIVVANKYEEIVKEYHFLNNYSERFCEQLMQESDLYAIINCIEKQIPRKPINETGYYRDNKCPNCNSRLKSGQGSSSRYRNNFCNKCGQKIDWGVNEESSSEKD